MPKEAAVRILSSRWWSPGVCTRFVPPWSRITRDGIGPSRRPLKDTLVSFYGRMCTPRQGFTSNKVAITMATLVSYVRAVRACCIVLPRHPSKSCFSPSSRDPRASFGDNALYAGEGWTSFSVQVFTCKFMTARPPRIGRVASYSSGIIFTGPLTHGVLFLFRIGCASLKGHRFFWTIFKCLILSCIWETDVESKTVLYRVF